MQKIFSRSSYFYFVRKLRYWKLRLYIRKLRKVLINARDVLWNYVLLEHYEFRGGLDIKSIYASTNNIVNNLIGGSDEIEGDDEESVNIRESIYLKVLDNKEIKYALIEYLKVRIFYCNMFSDNYKDEIKSLEERLNQLGISERINSYKHYIDLANRLSKRKRHLSRQVYAARKQIISEITSAPLSKFNLSLRMFPPILMIGSLVYLLGSYLYIDLLLREFGLDSLKLVSTVDYSVLALPQMQDVLIPLILGIIGGLTLLYAQADFSAIRSFHGVTQSRPNRFGIIVLLFIWGIALIHLLIVMEFNIDKIIDIFLDIFGNKLIFFVLCALCLVGLIPFERFLANGILIKYCIILGIVFIGGLLLMIPVSVENIKSPQSSKWMYVVENGVVTSDEYSVIFETSKYVIFYHRENETTRIVPVDDVREIVTHVPKA